MSKQQRIAVLILGLAVVVASFFILRPGDDDEGSKASTQGSTQQAAAPTTTQEAPPPTTPTAPPEPEITTIETRDGQPADGVTDLKFKSGETVRFNVTSNVDEEVHVHGYDIVEKVSAGGEARFSFKADLEGRFEIELHGSAAPIAELEVAP